MIIVILYQEKHKNEKLTQEDLDNLKELHDYSVELKNTLDQLSTDIGSGRISWGELTKKVQLHLLKKLVIYQKQF